MTGFIATITVSKNTCTMESAHENAAYKPSLLGVCGSCVEPAFAMLMVIRG